VFAIVGSQSQRNVPCPPCHNFPKYDEHLGVLYHDFMYTLTCQRDLPLHPSRLLFNDAKCAPHAQLLPDYIGKGSLVLPFLRRLQASPAAVEVPGFLCFGLPWIASLLSLPTSYA